MKSIYRETENTCILEKIFETYIIRINRFISVARDNPNNENFINETRDEFLLLMQTNFENIINRLDRININNFCKPDIFKDCVYYQKKFLEYYRKCLEEQFDFNLDQLKKYIENQTNSFNKMETQKDESNHLSSHPERGNKRRRIEKQYIFVDETQDIQKSLSYVNRHNNKKQKIEQPTK